MPSSPNGVTEDGRVHTHTAEGRVLGELNQFGSYDKVTVNQGKAGLDGGNGGKGNDIDAEIGGNLDPSKGTFSVVVTPTYIYLYSSKGVTIAVDRNIQKPSTTPNNIQ